MGCYTALLMKYFLSFGLLTLAFFAFGTLQKGFADECQTKGGLSLCPDNSVTLLKTVYDTSKNIYAPNLTLNDTKYHAGDDIIFHITIANKSKYAISQVIIKDTFPKYMTFSSGSGSFDPTSNTLSFLVFNLKPNQSQSYAITGKIVAVGQLPSDQSITCVANKATATLGTNQNLQSNAQFCIEKVFSATKVKTSPSTGPEELPVLGLIITSAAGIYMKKLSIKGKTSKR